MDALAFVELVEAPLNRAPMEEPLLSAVVANEPESTIPNESLDSAARHPSLLGRAHVCPRSTGVQYSFHLNAGVLPNIYGAAAKLIHSVM
jgi:hypothetical protein